MRALRYGRIFAHAITSVLVPMASAAAQQLMLQPSIEEGPALEISEPLLESPTAAVPNAIPCPTGLSYSQHSSSAVEYYLGGNVISVVRGDVKCGDTKVGTFDSAQAISAKANEQGESLSVRPIDFLSTSQPESKLSGSDVFIAGANAIQDACDTNSWVPTNYIDLLVLYTPEARVAAWGAAQANNPLSGAPSSWNAAYLSAVPNVEIAKNVALGLSDLNRTLCKLGVTTGVRISQLQEVSERESSSNVAYDLGRASPNDNSHPSPGLRAVFNHLAKVGNCIGTDCDLNTATYSPPPLDWVQQSDARLAMPIEFQPYQSRTQSDLVTLITADRRFYDSTLFQADCGIQNDLATSTSQGLSIISRDCLATGQLKEMLGHNLVGVALTETSPTASVVQPALDRVNGFHSRTAITHRVPSSPTAYTNVGQPIGAPGTGYTCDLVDPSQFPVPNRFTSTPDQFDQVNCIQAAIVAAQEGDSIQVLPQPSNPTAPYFQHLNIGLKNIKLLGDSQNPEKIQIDASKSEILGWKEHEGAFNPIMRAQRIALTIGGSQSRRCSYQASKNSPTQACTPNALSDSEWASWPAPQISGLTIKNGSAISTAGGVWCAGGANPSLVRNIIEGNTSDNGRGAGVSFESCGGVISSNIIRNNKILGGLGRISPLYDSETGEPLPGTVDPYSGSMDTDGTCWLRPHASDATDFYVDPDLTDGDSSMVSCHWDNKLYLYLNDASGNTLTSTDGYGYIGGAGIMVGTSRYWEDKYSSNIQRAVKINNNIIYSNSVPEDLLQFESKDSQGALIPTAPVAGAGVLLNGVPAILVNNTIVGNFASDHSGNVVTNAQVLTLPEGYVDSTIPGLFSGHYLGKAAQNMAGIGLGCIGSDAANSVIINNALSSNIGSTASNVDKNFYCSTPATANIWNNVTGGAAIRGGTNSNFTVADDYLPITPTSGTQTFQSTALLFKLPAGSLGARDGALSSSTLAAIPATDILGRATFNDLGVSTSFQKDPGAVEAQDRTPTGTKPPSGPLPRITY